MGRIILTNVGHLSKLRPCYSIEKKRETQLTTKLFVCGNFSRLKDNRWFRLNLDSNMEFLLLITSREVSGRRAGPREKRGRKRKKSDYSNRCCSMARRGCGTTKTKLEIPQRRRERRSSDSLITFQSIEMRSRSMD